MADSSAKPDAPGKVPILIDGMKIHAPRGDLTGLEIRNLVTPPIGTDRDLWLDRDGNLDDLISDDETVHLRPEMRFFTVPRVINPGAGDGATAR